MTEQDYKDRSKRLFQAAELETKDSTLRAALYAQSERIGMKAVALEIARKQKTLTAWGIPLLA
jgi:hypothetical protein